MLGGQSVGKARVWQEGLYCCFDCRCSFTGEVVYRLQLCCGEQRENLGIPVPQGSGFHLRTKIPVKRLCQGITQIRAVPKHAELGEMFIPLSPEEPFKYLKRLQDAFLQIREGKVGVVIPEAAKPPAHNGQ